MAYIVFNKRVTEPNAIYDLFQELVTVGSGGGGGRGSVVGFGPLDDLTPSDIRKLMAEYETANGERETLKQRCHELENQVNMLQDEKSNISAEFEQLQAQVG